MGSSKKKHTHKTLMFQDISGVFKQMFFQASCPSCHLTNSVKAFKTSVKTKQLSRESLRIFTQTKYF